MSRAVDKGTAIARKGRSGVRRKTVSRPVASDPSVPPAPALDEVEIAKLMPLDVLLRAMREHYAAGRFDEAAAFAKDAAPYIHGRQTGSPQFGSGVSLVRLEWLDPE